MARKRLTQIFPFLLPLRRFQRKMFFYGKMKLDRNKYAKEKYDKLLSYKIFETKQLMINHDSGFDIEYQKNKIHNLKLASNTINHIIIKPNEVFSFWQLVRNAEKHDKYKDGLALVDGKIVADNGGGLCQLSNLLFWIFLNAPLTIVERHTHAVEAFYSPKGEIPEGADATISEGWLDLKVKNKTSNLIQIAITFEGDYIIGSILSDKQLPYKYEIRCENLKYMRDNDKLYRENDIYRKKISSENEPLEDVLLFHNKCRLGYEPKEENL